jgi:UDP-N-acetylglucosamine--N-acetylmuramyl-(pentapeptide) pyrophosphoryl-undecaprenol N-acetylglucosamine transferase
VRILVTGGGTGGHVSPALAVIGAIREIAPASGRQPMFRYVGSENGIESRLAREAGCPSSAFRPVSCAARRARWAF